MKPNEGIINNPDQGIAEPDPTDNEYDKRGNALFTDDYNRAQEHRKLEGEPEPAAPASSGSSGEGDSSDPSSLNRDPSRKADE